MLADGADHRGWRSHALAIVSAVMFVMLAAFAVRNMATDNYPAVVWTAAGLPCVGLTLWAARTHARDLPAWAPYPMVLYFVATLFVFTFVQTVGQGASMMWYGVGPALVILTMGSRAGGLVSLVLLAMVIVGLLTVDHLLPFDYALRLCLSFVLSACIVYAYEHERERGVRALGAARERIDTLEWMLSICGWCHKQMRTQDGDWVSTEQFFEDRAPVQFTHGLCPNCAKTFDDQPAGSGS